jgi:hypothetical protein
LLTGATNRANAESVIYQLGSPFLIEIGVLTKADTVLPREHGPWIKILRGFQHKIKHGYYMTSQLSTEQVQQGKSWEDGRVQEPKYFASKTGPWRDEDPKRLGTENLVAALSKELKKMMSER